MGCERREELAAPMENRCLPKQWRRLGDLDNALHLIEEPIEQVERPGWEERVHYAEILRLKGWMLTLKNDLEGAEKNYLASLDWAREQQAKVVGAAHFHQPCKAVARARARTKEARDLLAPVYDWFTEGFDTKDLRKMRRASVARGTQCMGGKWGHGRADSRLRLTCRSPDGTRSLEQEQALAIRRSSTPTNVAVRKYLNARKVPHLFVGGSDALWSDYEIYPCTMGWGGSHQMEARLYAEHILANRPNAKIAILSINEEAGRDLVKGFKDGLGARAESMIVAEQTYEFSDPTVDSQIISLKTSGADTFFGAAGGKHASRYRKMYDIGWRPKVYIQVAAASPEGILKPAGLHTAKGFITAYYGKSPEFPSIRNDPAMQDYFAWAKKWYPDANQEDGIFTYGYQVAQAMEYVLRAAGDDLTRENIMRIATNMDGVELPMLYPGITANTSPTDYFPLEQFQMFEFNGENWLPFGRVVGK